MAELKYLLDKNKELTIEFEQALKDQARMNGDDGILVEHLNRLKVELERYQSRLQGQGDWPRKLQDEANRMKTKLTDIAIQRVRHFISLEYADSVKPRLSLNTSFHATTVDGHGTVRGMLRQVKSWSRLEAEDPWGFHEAAFESI